MRRVFSLILILALVLSLALSVSAANATSGTYKDTVKRSFKNGTLTISGKGPIDSQIADYPWRDFSEDIKKVVVKEGITSIGYLCFSGCVNLEEIQLPDSLEVIGQQALSRTKLKTINIPKNVHTIGNGKNSNDAFAQVVIQNDSLENIFVDDANPHYYDIDGVLYCKDSSVLVCFPKQKKLTSYTVPEGIKGIGHAAFSGVPLSSIKLPKGLKDIGPSAFSGTLISKITIPKGVTKIGGWAFHNCDKLQQITLPASVENINDTTFAYCDVLESVTVLNPDCLYRPTDDLFPRQTVLIAKKNSTIHQYAQTYGRKSQDVDTGKTTDYYREDGLMAFLPTDLKPSHPVYAEAASYSIETGAPSGYQPHIPYVTDTSHPTYQDIYNTTMEITKDCSTDEEKVKAVMHWVFENVEYAYGVTGGSFFLENIYSIWERPDRYGNCMVFTKFTNFMLSILKIPNATVTGDNHAWAMALIDGKWVTVDTTNCFYYPGTYYKVITNIMFCVGDVVCVIDDYTGVKLTSYGKSITDTTITNDIYVPSYVTSVYEHTFSVRKYAEGQEKVTVRGEKGSYIETYIREYFKDYTITYSGSQFTASPHKHTPGAYQKDGTQHWQICSGCGEALNRKYHEFDGCTDTKCDTCGQTRKVSHYFDGPWKSDDDGHWQLCIDCNSPSTAKAHDWDKGKTEGDSTVYTCTVCGKQKTVTNTAPTEPTAAPTEATTEPTIAPTEPTAAPTEPTVAPTEPETTTPPATTAPATEPSGTTAPTEPTTSEPNVPDPTIPIGIWVAIGASVLAIAVVVTVVLVKKRK